MCGILFALAKPHHHSDLDKFLADAFLASQVRGTDSSGIFRVSHKPNMKNADRTIFREKAAVSATDFLKDTKASQQIKAANHSAITVGHVRARTHGAVSNSNAHPFEVMRSDMTELIGVHNGSLNGWKDMKEGKDYEVDSEWMLNMIADDGTAAFKGFDGAYVLVWYDTADPDVLNVARNDKRTLYFAWTKDKKGMLAASELGMLGWLADRNKIELWADTDGRKYFYFSPKKLYRINVNTMEIISSEDLPDYDAHGNPYKLERPKVMGNSFPSANRWADPYAHRFDQDHVITTVEKIVNEARQKRECPIGPGLLTQQKDEDVITADELADGADIAANVKGHMALDEVEVGKRLTYAEGVGASSASPSEVKLAKDLGYFGLVGRVWPYYHDEEVSELLCSFAVGNTSQKGSATSGEFKNDATIRFVTTDMIKDSAIYSDPVIDKMRFAVIGVHEHKPINSPPFPKLILAPINNKHRLIQRRVTPNEVAEKIGATLH